MDNIIPVRRNYYRISRILESGSNYGRYELHLEGTILFSKKHRRIITITCEFFDVEKPNVYDVLELPDSMLCYDINGRIIDNDMLCLGIPDEKAPIPKDFNIEEDYAYLIYTKTNKRVLLQRYYG